MVETELGHQVLDTTEDDVRICIRRRNLCFFGTGRPLSAPADSADMASCVPDRDLPRLRAGRSRYGSDENDTAENLTY